MFITYLQVPQITDTLLYKAVKNSNRTVTIILIEQ